MELRKLTTIDDKLEAQKLTENEKLIKGHSSVIEKIVYLNGYGPLLELSAIKFVGGRYELTEMTLNVSEEFPNYRLCGICWGEADKVCERCR